MSAETELARLERQVLGIARVSRFLDAVDELRRMLAREDPRLRARVLSLVAPALGRDLAAAVGAAFDIGIRDAVGMLGEDAPTKLPKLPPSALVTAARATEREIAGEIAKARKLAGAGVDDFSSILAPVFRAANVAKRDVATLVNHAGNMGTTAVADAADLPTVWIAETNACVECLAYSGRIAKPDKTFPGGLTYGRPTGSGSILTPPRHPRCRCTVEVLLSREYAEALKREADRSVLRGFSLESESMSVRVDAARRLVEKGVDAPKSVIAFANRSIKAGEFPTRGRP